MPHFAVDESAHAHRKVMRAGNAAFGLWTRFGSYACDYLTDGLIPAEIANSYGTTPQLKKLAALGMIHGADHACSRCPQPEPGDYVVHDYLGPNPSRAVVEKRREQAADKKRKQRAAAEGAGNRDGNENFSSSNREGIDDENTSNQTTLFGDFAGQSDVSPGDESQTRARPRPAPSPSPASPTEKPASRQGEQQRSGGIPDRLEPLRTALAASGLGAVAWDIRKVTDWERIRRQMDRLGIDLMVKSALAAARTRGEPDSVTAWISRWESLADPQPDAPLVTASPGGADVVPIRDRQQQATDDMFDRAMARAKARTQQESS
jgi:hypothetical protein